MHLKSQQEERAKTGTLNTGRDRDLDSNPRTEAPALLEVAGPLGPFPTHHPAPVPNVVQVNLGSEAQEAVVLSAPVNISQILHWCPHQWEE